MRRFIILLILLTAASSALAEQATPPTIQLLEGKVRPKDWQEQENDPARPSRFIEVTGDIELVCPLKHDELSPRSLILAKGTYGIERRIHHKKDGTEWLILPAVSSSATRFGYNNSAGRTWGYQHAIAVNPDSLAIFPREVVRYTQEWQRLDGSRWNEPNWTFGCAPTLVGASQIARLRFVTEEHFQAARAGHSRQLVQNTLEEGLRRKQVLDRERLQKSQIGTQLCKENGPLTLQGFTEGKSPDNDKLRIRIWRASVTDAARPSTLVSGDFRESTVWDSPDNWRLCE